MYIYIYILDSLTNQTAGLCENKEIKSQENSARIRMIHWQIYKRSHTMYKQISVNGRKKKVASCISDFSGPKGVRFKIVFCQEVQISGIKRQTH